MMDVYIFVLLGLALLGLVLYFIVRPRPARIPIKNRHVFITGGSSGIGLALAHLCAHQGADVSLLARNAAKLEEAKQAIKLATGRDARVFSADVRDYDAVRKAIQDAGPIDVLVCNHGVFMPQELIDQELEEIKFMIDVNVNGTFHLIKAALPGMKETRAERGPGSIAIMSSQAGQLIQPVNLPSRVWRNHCNKRLYRITFIYHSSSLQTPILRALRKRTKEDPKSPVS